MLGIDPRDWPAVSELLDRAMDLAPAARGAWLDSLPRGAAAHRETLARLLSADGGDDDAGAMFDALPRVDVEAVAADRGDALLAAGEHVGPYVLLTEIGRGGMGSVWLAERSDGQLRRRVALKLPHLGWAPGLLERLGRERDILASLEHPLIARLYDAGVDTLGRPFLALEYVDGTPIDRFADERHLDVRARLALLLQVADAVAHAHTHLVIHRDLKPSNILVTASGDVRLLDFGIAKLVQEGDEAEASELTRTHGRALTLDYASPEQIAGGRIGTASDVYGLGVVAYELLAGDRPYRLAAGIGHGPAEWIEKMRVEPPSRRASLAATRRQLEGDLDAILNRALKIDPAERYQTVTAFSDDLRRHIAGDPVLARPDTWLYRSRKFVARHALTVSAASLLSIAIVVGAGVSLWQSRVARLEASRANAVQGFLKDIFATSSARQPDPETARKVTARELLDIGASKLESQLAGQPAAEAEVTRMLRDLYSDLGLTRQSAALARRAATLAAAQHGEVSVEHLLELATLSEALHEDDGLEERRRVIEHALSISKRLPDRPTRARMLLYNELAQFHASGDLRQSREYGELALRDARAAGTAADIVIIAGVTASTAERLGNLPLAEERLAEAIALGERTAETPGFDLLRTRTLLGEVQTEQLRFDAAEATMRAALRESIRVNGPAHLDTTQVRFRLGATLASAGRLRDALEPLQEDLRVLDAARPPDEFTLPHVLLALGTTLREIGRAPEAIAHLRRALEIRDRNRPGTLVAARLREELAMALVDAGQPDEAVQLTTQADEIRRRLGERIGEPTRDRLVEAELYLAHERGDLVAQRRLIGELHAASPTDDTLSLDWVDGALVRARVALDEGRAQDGLLFLRRLRAKLLERELVGRVPLVDGQRLMLCGRVAAALDDRDGAARLFSRARSAYGDQLDPSSRMLRELAGQETSLGSPAAPVAPSRSATEPFDCP